MKNVKNNLVILILGVLFSGNVFSQIEDSASFNYVTRSFFLGNLTPGNTSHYFSFICVDFSFKGGIQNETNRTIKGDLVGIIPGKYNGVSDTGFVKLSIGSETDTGSVQLTPCMCGNPIQRHSISDENSHIYFSAPICISVDTFLNENEAVLKGGFCIIVETLDPKIYNEIQFMAFNVKKNPMWKRDRNLAVQVSLSGLQNGIQNCQHGHRSELICK